MKSLFDEIVGENLRSLRESAQVSQEELAMALFLDKEALSRIEGGKQKIIPFQVWQAAQFFNVEGERILRG